MKVRILKQELSFCYLSTKSPEATQQDKLVNASKKEF